MQENKLFLVIPCYNEEQVIEETANRLLSIITKMIAKEVISSESRIVFVNDGSKDKTWQMISALHAKNKLFSGVNLSRNVGHQNALLAGLMTVKKDADVVISLDADLQDDINVIWEFMDKYDQGNEIVYGVRNSRDTDTFFKKNTAQLFYRLMENMGVDTVYNHADYRLMSKRVLDELENFKEINLFLRGIIPLIGFRTDIVEYKRNERFAGESKYPLRKMLSFALNGITSFSVKPIRFVSILGFCMVLISIFILIYALFARLTENVVKGWTFIIMSIWLLSGVQLLSLGIIGEYIGKIYSEVKQRPRYIVEKYINDQGGLNSNVAD